MSVGSRLKQQRVRANLEIKEAAHRVKKSYQYVRQLEEGVNDPPTWSLLGEFARVYGTSVDYLLELTDNPQPASNNALPEGAQEMLEYLSCMSPRGRAQLLEVAKILFKDDQEWKQRDDLRSGFKLILGETTLAAIEAELPSMLAESSDNTAVIMRVLNTLRQNMSSNGG